MDLFGFNLDLMEYWHWLALAAVFFVVELLTMSFFCLWLGMAAVFVAAVAFIMPDLGWEILFSLWAGMAVVDVMIWRWIKKRRLVSVHSEEPLLNKRGEQYVGRILTLEEPIVNGFGKVKADDSIWRVEFERDLPAGTKVRVTGLSGTVFLVEPVEP
jgi:membrane protein implicated in regulation of membrane protease activity